MPRRQPTKITATFMFTCGKLGMTHEEMAALCGVTHSVIDRRLSPNPMDHDPELYAAYHAGRAELAKSLRRAQIESALGKPAKTTTDPDGSTVIIEKARAGNPVSQIWLGKQILGQKDHTESAPKGNTTNIFIAQWGGATNEQVAGATTPAGLPQVIDAEAEEIPDDEP